MKCRCAVLATAVVGGLIVAGCGGADPPPGAIIMAGGAPYVAVIGRSARMLCAAFTTAVADRLARDVSRSDDCIRTLGTV